MDPRAATDAERDYWNEREGRSHVPVVIGGPEEAPDVVPCPTLVTPGPGQRMCHVAYQLNEIELAVLAQGGTLWLSTWGGLPIHLLEVVPLDRSPSPRAEQPPNDDGQPDTLGAEADDTSPP